jgi:O-antigen/teichoic acid export membrane protein
MTQQKSDAVSQQGVRSSLLVIMSQSGFMMFLQFVASVFIARLLTPVEVGVFSVSMVLIALGNTLRDFGVVDFVVQDRHLDQSRLRAASFLAYASSWTLALIIWIAAPFAAAFYGLPDIRNVMWLLAINFFLTPLGTVAMAYMRRERQFNRIATIRALRGLLQSMGGVALAWWGMSYYSMALSGIAAAILVQFLISYWWPAEVPRMPHWRGMKSIFAFGGFSTLGNIIKELDRGAPDLILGRTLDMSAVAYFGRASGLINTFNRLVIQMVMYVALPFLAKEIREDASQAARIYLASIPMLTGVAWPFLAFLAINAWAIIPTLYGPQWDQAVPLAATLCLGEMLLVPFYLQGSLLIAKGLVKVEAVRNLGMGLVKLPPLLFLGTHGLATVVEGYAFSCLLAAGISQIILNRYAGVAWMQTLQANRSSFLLLLGFGLAMLGLDHWLVSHDWTPLPALLLTMPSAILVWCAGLFLFRHPLKNEVVRAVGRVRAIVRKRG